MTGVQTCALPISNDVFNYLKSGKIINLILLDLKMPEKDGFYVLRKLKNENYNIAVIVLTAYADVKSAIESARLGACDFISKPYDLDDLIITIRNVLQKDTV